MYSCHLVVDVCKFSMDCCKAVVEVWECRIDICDLVREAWSSFHDCVRQSAYNFRLAHVIAFLLV